MWTRSFLRRLTWIVLLWMPGFGVPRLPASGPRYVTGPPFFTAAAGRAIGWKQVSLLYFTDPADLSKTVDHPTADALVAAAAGVWNLPAASITVGRGGALAEHVSGQNVYLSTDGMVWPNDVESSNAAAIPVAVVYDTDGSVTDTLLGAGASDPSGCRQNAVTEDVDAFDPAGYILHAVIVVNGRCTGTAPEQQLQMQYQLERAFGRVLGLAWSQVNENVFTGSPTPTSDEAMHWPIMHPIDILCGPYSYQCLPQPFTLRSDDIAGMVGLYPIAAGTQPAAGKQVSLTTANTISGSVLFPSGEGMAGVNVLVRRQNTFTSTPLGWLETGAVSGSFFRRAGNSPFAAAASDPVSSMGTTNAASQGAFVMPYVPIIDPYGGQTEVISTEAVNPLYAGALSLGPYTPGVVAPAGSAPVPFVQFGVSPTKNVAMNFAIGDAPAACGNGLDGTASTPVALAATGWWSGLVCGYGHVAYSALAVRAGRSLTVEVTALDADGFATTSKLMPVIGLFAPTDAAGSLPSLGLTPGAFTSAVLGTTNLHAAPFAAGGAGGTVRVAIADQRGDGRPDYPFQARVFYADTVTPATLTDAGGQATITGAGFRAGNSVLVNGVATKVISGNANTLVFQAPSMALAQAMAAVPVDLEVDDPGTGASTVMTGAFTYDPAGTAVDSMSLVSAPTGTVFAGDASPVGLAVQMLGSDGTTPAAGEAVVFSATNATFSACGLTTCSLMTDAKGIAASGVTPLAAGAVSLVASAGSATQSVTFSAQSKATSLAVILAPTGSVLVGRVATPVFEVQLLDAQGRGIAGRALQFSVDPGSTGSATFGSCNATPCSLTTNASGQAQVTVTASSAGTVMLIASDGNLTQTASFQATANANLLTLTQVPAASSYVQATAGTLQARLTQSDGTAITKAPVQLSAPAGAIFTQCSSNTCVLDTDGQGYASSNVTSTATGTYSLTAAYGGVTASTTISVVASPPATVTILSAPSGNLPVGVVAAVPFSAQVLDGKGKPVTSTYVAIGGPLDAVVMGCGVPSCKLTTDSRGMVTQTVTPVKPGLTKLEVVYGTISASASFTAIGPGETWTVTASPPASVTVGGTVTFSLIGVAADGVTPVANRYVWVTVTSGNVAIKGCAYGLCKFYTDAQGKLTITATTTIAGVDTLTVNLDGIVRTATFTAVPKAYVVKVISAPSGTYLMGTPETVPFTVQVLQPDGTNPAPQQNVTFSQVGGGVQMAACSAPTCTVLTNGSGLASTGSLTLAAPGAATLLASVNTASSAPTATFNVLSNVDVVKIVSAPASVLAGETAAVPFTIAVLQPDGVTPVAGMGVGFAGAVGSVSFSGCGSASCSLITDARGYASSSASGVSAGSGAITATVHLPTGDQVLSAPFQVLTNLRQLSAGASVVYLAEGATVTLPVAVTATQNSVPAPGVPVAWSGGAGVSVSGVASATSSAGIATMQVTFGPLAAGSTATVSACAWGSICTSVQAQGVPAGSWQVALVSGGRQTAAAGVALQPLVARVTDGQGHGVAGAPVHLGQAASPLDGSCPALGRCPAVPMLARDAALLTSDGNGLVSLAPMIVAGRMTFAAIALSAGTHGFATAVVGSLP